MINKNKKKPIRVKNGDIIEIPLPGRKKTFAQFLLRDKWGDLISVFDYVVDYDKKVDINTLRKQKAKLPPILTRLKHGFILSGLVSHLNEFKANGIELEQFELDLLTDKTIDPNWKIIGNIPVKNFVYPNFIWKEGGPESKIIVTRSHWFLYDGQKDIEIGKSLPDQYKNFEYKSNYSPGAVIERILTGKNPDEELIRKG